MNKQQAFLLIGIIVVSLAVIAIAFFQFFNRDDVDEDHVVDDDDDEQIVDEAWSPESIDALHQFREGRHIVAGEIDMPTPCHLLEYDFLIQESDPETVILEFGSLVGDDEVCAQVITPQRFKFEFDASEDAVIRATFNGEDIDLTLHDVPEGEDLEDFEVFIKG